MYNSKPFNLQPESHLLADISTHPPSVSEYPTIKVPLHKHYTMPIPTSQPQPTELEDSAAAQQQQQSAPGSQATGAGANTGAGTTRPKTAEELEADRLYEEAMEEEYAKRDGGA